MTKTNGIGGRTLFAVAAVLVVVCARPMVASTVAVGTCVAGVVQYSTIQAAVTAVKATSTIEVCPGTYPEQVVINKQLNLTGVASGSADNPTIVIPASGFVANTSSLTTEAPIAAQILVTSPATGVTISNLTVDGSGSNLNSSCDEPPLIGIYYQNASGAVTHVAVRNQAQNAANFSCQASAGLGIFVESLSPGVSTVSIESCGVHGYQKNGITADEAGTKVTIIGNNIAGAGPVDTAQNGIQVAFGATGDIESNTIADDLYNGNPSEGLASGILIYDAGDMTISSNTVSSTQFGIAIVTDGTLPANGNTVTSNHIMNTEIGDGIDLCSNDNTATSNVVFTSGQSGIHLDSTCVSSGNNNAVSKNSVVEACAGILLGSGTGNTFPSANTSENVNYTTLAGDTCTATNTTSVSGNVLRSVQRIVQPHHVSPVRP